MGSTGLHDPVRKKTAILDDQKRAYAGRSLVVGASPPHGIGQEPGAGGSWFRSAEKTETTCPGVPPHNVAERGASDDKYVWIPLRLTGPGDRANASGKVAQFVFPAQFMAALASSMNLSPKILRHLAHVLLCFNEQNDALCRLLLDEAANGYSRGPLYFRSVARMFARVILARLGGKGSVQVPPVTLPEPISRAVHRIEDHFLDGVSLAELAKEAGMSQRHFARLFRHAAGCPPHQYLLRIRVSRARTLMMNKGREMDLAEIAAACGFSDQAHLGRHFRRAFGVTPGTFLRAGERSRMCGRNVLDPHLIDEYCCFSVK